MAVKRKKPYVWATWLPKLLDGDDSCEWAIWFQSQHDGKTYEKKQDDFNLSGWLVNHTEALNQERDRLEALGYTVRVEGQNEFKVHGTDATLAGKPDLVALSNGQGTVIDVKSGKPNPAHQLQVLIYMYGLPLFYAEYEGMAFDGRIVYSDHEVEIPASTLNREFVTRLGSLIKKMASATPARKVPSHQECGYCKLTSADCPERIDHVENTVVHVTDF